MTEHNIHHQADPSLHHDHEDDSPEAIAERMRALFGDTKTTFDELRELAADPSASKRLEVFLDDLTYEALYENEAFKKNIEMMHSGKLSSQRQIEVRDNQLQLFNEYRNALIREAGLPTEAGMSEMQKAKERIQEIVSSSIDKSDNLAPTDILQTLGILQLDDEGREYFSYPEGLFPKVTDEKWLTYLETVRTHLRTERAVHAKLKDKTELGVADNARRVAHDAITRDVNELLGLDQLPDSDWDFKKTRNLLAKMRDSRFPTVETAEKFVTEKAVIEGVIGAHAVRALAIRLSEMHK